MLCRAVQTSAITNFLQIFITMTIENKHSKKISIVKVKRSTQKYLYIFSTEKMKIIFITIALASMIQVVPAPFCSGHRGCYVIPASHVEVRIGNGEQASPMISSEYHRLSVESAETCTKKLSSQHYCYCLTVTALL